MRRAPASPLQYDMQQALCLPQQHHLKIPLPFDNHQPSPSTPQAPQLFDTLGSGGTWGLIVHCIIGAVNVVTTFVAVFTVDG